MEANTTPKIFIVDDDEFCRQLYQQSLIANGWTDVTTFASGTACLDALTEIPQVIFLDHSMDVLTGLEVLRKIKRFNPDIYVVFISGQEDMETTVTALKYGAFDYIVKGNNETEKMIRVLRKIEDVNLLLSKRRQGFFRKILSL